MEKTIVVEVKRRYRHALYKKVVQARNTFAAHDEENQARPGDAVEIMETRPISKTKRWRLVRILKAASPAGPEK
jgi:small subunit ribosomal protein S17